jgi:hypothetical protein
VERNPPVYHLGELILIPNLVDELRVDTHSEDFDAQFLQLTVVRSDR